jgi:hypothetical protein
MNADERKQEKRKRLTADGAEFAEGEKKNGASGVLSTKKRDSYMELFRWPLCLLCDLCALRG